MNEIVYIIFLLSGILKVFLEYFNISIGIDFTLLVGLVLLLLIVHNFLIYGFRIKINRTGKYAIVILVAFLTLILGSIFYSSSQVYIYTKILQFLTLLLSFLFPLIIKRFSTIKFKRYFIMIVLGLTIIYLPLFYNSSIMYKIDYDHDSIYYDMYQSYLSMGYIIAIALIINLFSKNYTSINRILIAIFLIASLFITGARGPFLGVLFIGFLFIFQFRGKLKKPKLKTTFVLILVAISFMIFFINKVSTSDLFDRSYTRLVALSSIKDDVSANDRLEQLDFSIGKIKSETLFFGYGFGSYGYEKTGKDIRYYPHNIFIEILFELGIIGLFLYVLFIILIVKKLLNIKEFVLWALFIFFFLNSLKSLSLTDSRIMFGFFAILILSNKMQNNNYTERLK